MKQQTMTAAEFRASQGGNKPGKPPPAPRIERTAPEPTTEKAKPAALPTEANTPKEWGGHSDHFGNWLKYTGLSDTQQLHLRAYAHQYLNLP